MKKTKTVKSPPAGRRVEPLVRQRPRSVTQMMNRYRRGNPPHKRKTFQLAIVIHAIDRETAIDELENKLVTFREQRIGEGGIGGSGCGG